MFKYAVHSAYAVVPLVMMLVSYQSGSVDVEAAAAAAAYEAGQDQETKPAVVDAVAPKPEAKPTPTEPTVPVDPPKAPEAPKVPPVQEEPATVPDVKKTGVIAPPADAPDLVEVVVQEPYTVNEKQCTVDAYGRQTGCTIVQVTKFRPVRKMVSRAAMALTAPVRAVRSARATGACGDPNCVCDPCECPSVESAAYQANPYVYSNQAAAVYTEVSYGPVRGFVSRGPARGVARGAARIATAPFRLFRARRAARFCESCE